MLAGDDGSLDGADGTGVIDELPEDRVAYAFVSAEGARALFGRAALEPIDTFIDSAATEGAAASLSADGSGLRLAVRSDLDPDRDTSSPGFFAALPSFTPTLTSQIGPSALGVPRPRRPAGGCRQPPRSGPVELPRARCRLPPSLSRARQAGGDRHRRRPAARCSAPRRRLTLQPVAADAEEAGARRDSRTRPPRT